MATSGIYDQFSWRFAISLYLQASHSRMGGNNPARWHVKRIIKICDLIAERRTLPVLRAVRLRLLAILCRRTTMLKDVARLVVKNAARYLAKMVCLSLATKTQSPWIASDEAPTVDDHKERNE
jgi:hypothetical protein